MKKIRASFLLLFTVLLLPVLSHARKINQSFIGVSYKLTKNWAVDGFSSSSVCNCPGTINIYSKAGKEDLYMVVYGSKFEEDMNGADRSSVWGAHFDFDHAEEMKIAHSAKHRAFDIYRSQWEGYDPKHEDYQLRSEVWALKIQRVNQFYTLYFWALPSAMQGYKKMIVSILESMKFFTITDE